MAEATITIRGESDEAVQALQDAEKAVVEVDTALADAGESAQKAGRQLTTASTAAGSMRAASQRAIGAVNAFGGSVGNLAGGLSSLSPALGSSVGGLGRMAAGLTNVVGALNPVSLGITAVTVAAGSGVAAWTRYRTSVRDTEAALADASRGLRSVSQALAVSGDAAGRAAGRFASLASTLPEVSSALEEFERANRAVTAASALEQADRDLSALLTRRNQLTEATQRNTDAYEREQRTLERLEATRGTTRRQLREQAELVSSLRDRVDGQRGALSRLNDEIERNWEEQDRATVAAFALERSGRRLGDVIEDTSAAAQSGARDWAAWADAVLLTDLRVRDLSGSIEAIARGGEGASLIASQLSDLSDASLAALGATADQIEQIRAVADEARSGADLLRQFADERASIEEAARQAEIVGLGKVKQEAIDRYRVEMDAIRELEEAKQAATEATIARLQAEKQATVDALDEARQALTQGGIDTAIGGLAGGVEDLFFNLGKSGKAADSLGKATAKSIGTMASNFGSLALAQGAAMLLMPGLQGNAGALIAAGGALKILGATLGGVGARGGGGAAQPTSGAGGGAQPGTATTVVDTSRRVEPGRMAREQGERQEVADRYGIDRGRAWA